MNNLLLVIVLSLATAQRDLGVDARLHSGVASKHMSTTREIIVWLPPGCATETEKRYPVLYMHDGQNVYVLFAPH